MHDVLPLLSVKDLSVQFLTPQHRIPFKVLDGINFNVAAGETLGLVGESGSGKTTLGRALLRITPASNGSIVLKGENIIRYSQARLRPLRKDMQMIFQDPASSFNPRQTVGKALSIALSTHKTCPAEKIPEQINTLLERVGLTASFKSRLPHEMSGGQLQRVAIARALALRPALIIADEAVSKLDVSVRAGILNLLRELQEEEQLSLIFITHDLEVARYLCHTIIVLYHGKILEYAPAQELFERPIHPYTALLLNAGKTTSTTVIPTTPIDTTQPLPTHGCRYANACPYVVDKCLLEHPPLTIVGANRSVACWRNKEMTKPLSTPDLLHTSKELPHDTLSSHLLY